MASRPSRHVALEEGQRWNNLHPDCDRCVFETSLVRSAKEQVGSLFGRSLYIELLGNGHRTHCKLIRASNRVLQKLLKEHDVHHSAMHNEETTACIVEMFNRNLKTRMQRCFTKNQSVRYVDVLQAFMRSHNDT